MFNDDVYCLLLTLSNHNNISRNMDNHEQDVVSFAQAIYCTASKDKHTKQVQKAQTVRSVTRQGSPDLCFFSDAGAGNF